MSKIAELKAGLANRPGFAEAYEAANEEFALIETLVAARARAKLSQSELADRLGTTQSSIARLEAGGVTPTLKTLRRYAAATGMRLKVELIADK